MNPLPRKKLTGFLMQYERFRDDVAALVRVAGEPKPTESDLRKIGEPLARTNDVFWDFLEENGRTGSQYFLGTNVMDNLRSAQEALLGSKAAKLSGIPISTSVSRALRFLMQAVEQLQRPDNENVYGDVHVEAEYRERRKQDVRGAAESADGGLICMGREIALVLRSGRELELPKRVGMLYDGSGKYWPKCSLLIAHFDSGECKVDDGDARAYFGRSTTVYEGKVLLPPKTLTKWRRVGEVKEIFYDRAGDRASGPFRHEFNKPRGTWKLIHWMKGKAASDPAVLYRLERNVYRVELPDGCIVGDRGIALP